MSKVEEQYKVVECNDDPIGVCLTVEIDCVYDDDEVNGQGKDGMAHSHAMSMI